MDDDCHPRQAAAVLNAFLTPKKSDQLSGFLKPVADATSRNRGHHRFQKADRWSDFFGVKKALETAVLKTALRTVFSSEIFP